MTTYIVEQRAIDESQFYNPKKRDGARRAEYPRQYEMIFKSISPNGQFTEIDFQDVFSNFPTRNGNRNIPTISITINGCLN